MTDDLTRTALARHFGVSLAVVRDWIRRDCPRTCVNPWARKKHYRFSLMEIKHWLKSQEYHPAASGHPPARKHQAPAGPLFIGGNRLAQMRKQGIPIPPGAVHRKSFTTPQP